MLEADQRPHQADAGGEGELVAAHRPEGQIRLAESRFRALASLQRPYGDRSHGPAELRFPDEACIAELRTDSKIPVAARSELAEAAVEPAFLAVEGDQANVAAEF